MSKSSIGKVYLVGAGPGDEGLLTVKADNLLSNAKLVIYDRLVSSNIMARIPKSAELINVGKNAGNHPIPQDEINQILLNKALEGHEVIRLKGGDSFVFGRGGEELELLTKHSIPFEVIPGITSPIAAAAYAGIPVTHRDYCSSLHIITGHAKKDSCLNIDYNALVKLSGTIIFMMSVANAAELMDGLIKAGMPDNTPSAIIENGTLPSQRKFISTISTLAQSIKDNSVKSPSIVIVGKVCTLSEQFDWFSKLPLLNKKILVTRPIETSSKLSSKLTQLGADVTLLPAIKTAPIDFVLPDLSLYSTLIFTSQAGVHAFFSKLYTEYDSRVLFGKKIAVVGNETACALLSYGIKADFVPTVFSGESLARELTPEITPNEKILLLRAKVVSREICDVFRENDILFDEVAVYETFHTQYKMQCDTEFDIITFTSASCVNGFIESVGTNFQDSAKIICIGEQTATQARKHGLNPIISKESTIVSMVELILNL